MKKQAHDGGTGNPGIWALAQQMTEAQQKKPRPMGQRLKTAWDALKRDNGTSLGHLENAFAELQPDPLHITEEYAIDPTSGVAAGSLLRRKDWSHVRDIIGNDFDRPEYSTNSAWSRILGRHREDGVHPREMGAIINGARLTDEFGESVASDPVLLGELLQRRAGIPASQVAPLNPKMSSELGQYRESGHFAPSGMPLHHPNGEINLIPGNYDAIVSNKGFSRLQRYLDRDLVNHEARHKINQHRGKGQSVREYLAPPPTQKNHNSAVLLGFYSPERQVHYVKNAIANPAKFRRLPIHAQQMIAAGKTPEEVVEFFQTHELTLMNGKPSKRMNPLDKSQAQAFRTAANEKGNSLAPDYGYETEQRSLGHFADTPSHEVHYARESGALEAVRARDDLTDDVINAYPSVQAEIAKSRGSAKNVVQVPMEFNPGPKTQKWLDAAKKVGPAAAVGSGLALGAGALMQQFAPDRFFQPPVRSEVKPGPSHGEAQNQTEGPWMTKKQRTEAQGVSMPYLHQLMAELEAEQARSTPRSRK